jgi:hypothetical protein
MGRIRSIKPEFPQSESMGRMKRESRLCFLQLWTLADDSGRLRGNSRMLASLLYPYDNDAKDLVDNWLDELEREECIFRYAVDGDSYIEIRNWLKHQKIDHPSKSKFPEPPEGWRILARTREASLKIPLDQGSRIKEGIKEGTLVPTSDEVATAQPVEVSEVGKRDKFGLTDAEKATAVKDIFAYYLTATNRNPNMNTFNEKKRKLGRVCLEYCLSKSKRGDSPQEHLGLAVELMEVAVDTMAASPWHMGTDLKSNGSYYNDWDKHLFKDVDKLEWWWNRADSPRKKAQSA